jgi:uncharacterized C2H2 Zn-finger protein
MAEFLLILVPVAIIALVFLVSMLAVRGRELKCPECGTVFKGPMADNKRSGLGSTFPYTGVVKCPKCGQSRGRRDYLKPTAPTEKAPAT